MDQRVDHIFDLPDFSFWSAPVRRRIHDDRIVSIAAADFPFYKFDTVIHKPADRRIFQTGRDRVFFRPCDHSFGSVHMSDLCAGSCSCECGAACVGEQIQDFDRATAFWIRSENQSQFVACSGNSPVCLKLNGFRLKVSDL